MVNTFAPFGFREYGERDGQAPTMGQETWPLMSSDPNLYFTGDVVAISSQSATPGTITMPTTGVTMPGGGVLGIFVGCEFFNPTTQRNEWHPNFSGNVGSSAVGKAYVVTDPERLFIAQATSGAVLGTSVIGWNIGFTSTGALGIQTGGNTISGVSNVALISTSVGGAATLPFRIFATYQSFAPPGGFVNGTSSGAEGCQIMVVQGNNWARVVTAGVST